jgi:hypothetical protein
MSSVEPQVRALAPPDIEAEPWVDLPGGRELASWSREDEISYNQRGRQTEKLRFFRMTFDFLTDNRVAGDYHEFGCHRARTFRMALSEARRHGRDAMKFFAFDSFQGLPQTTSGPSVEIWTPGALTTTEETFRSLIQEHGVYTDRVTTVKGFYSESLTEELCKRFEHDESPIALACIDCDLYESAVPVFRFIEPLLQEGSVLYLDDLFAGYKGSPRKGVARAFREFREQSTWQFVRHLDVGWWGRSYIAYRDENPARA